MSAVSVIFIMIFLIPSEAFFTYEDCDESCRAQQISCVISEETKQFFVCHCLESETTCEILATPITVCLQPNRDPIGGQKIWDDYAHRNSTTTQAPPASSTAAPTTPPAPGPRPAARDRRS